jgi:hypothetical protein
MIPQDRWVHTTKPMHFIASDQCRFFLGTIIGDMVVSTVGDYRPSHAPDRPCEIGWQRTYETMVFKGAFRCECGGELCPGWGISDHCELSMLPANCEADARRNHEAECLRVAGELS